MEVLLLTQTLLSASERPLLQQNLELHLLEPP